MREFKVGDKVKVLVNYYSGCMPNGRGPKIGDILTVVGEKECTTPGNWIDARTAEVKQVNFYGNTEFALVEVKSKRFALGDRVISIIDTPNIPEGFIGHVFSVDKGPSWDYMVQGIKDQAVEYFNEEELELLSAAHNHLENIETIRKKAREVFGLLVEKDEAEYTGGSSSYYKVDVTHPTTSDAPYQAECNDVIEALGLTFTEGNIFKAIWRIAADRQGKKKKGNNSVYDAEKVVFFAERLLIQEKSKEGT